MKLSEMISAGFDVIFRLLIWYSAFASYCREKWEYIGTVYQLFISLEMACGSVRREVLYNIVI